MRECTLDYVQRSSGRQIAQYTLDLVDPATGGLWQRTVTGLTYGGGRTRKLWSRLLAADPAALTPVGTPPLLPLIYIPEIDTLVQVFPYDRRLPALRDLLLGAPALQAALDAALGPGEGEGTAWQARIVRYRPGMRATIRLARSHQATTRVVYTKVYRDDELGEQAFRVLRHLWQQTTRQEASFAVPRPLGYVPGPRTLLVAELPCQTLLDIVRGAEETEARCVIRRTAYAVAELHQLPLDKTLLPTAERDERARLADLTAALTAIDPQQASALARIGSAIAARLDDAVWTPAPIHGDLRLLHILFDGDQVGLLDFDKLASGDPLVDVAAVTAILLSKARTDLAETFVTDYSARVPASWQERYPARHALALLSEAATTGRGQRGRPQQTNRVSRVAAVVEQARDALAGKLW